MNGVVGGFRVEASRRLVFRSLRVSRTGCRRSGSGNEHEDDKYQQWQWGRSCGRSSG